MDSSNRRIILIVLYMYLCDNMIFFYRFVNGYAENLSNICSFSCTASVYSWKCEGEFSFLAHLSGHLHQVKYLFICRTKVSMLIIEIAQITCKWKRPTLKNMPRHNRASVLWSVLTFSSAYCKWLSTFIHVLVCHRFSS